jgi:hypothetical protein
MKKLVLFFIIAGAAIQVQAQNVGIGTTTPHANAILEVNSSNKGLLLPRVADTNAVSGPKPAGLTVYSNSDNKLYFYNGTKWQSSAAANGSDSLWYLKNDSVNYTDRKYVGINTDLNLLPPQATLQITGDILIQGATVNSNAAATAGQTITMDNTPLLQNGNPNDSVNRIIDPGGIGVNYFNNMQGNVLLSHFGDVYGYKLIFNTADFGLATGDTLWISGLPFPACRTNYHQRYTNINTAPMDAVISSSGYLYVIFRSNGDGQNAAGFDLTVKKVYQPTTSKEIQAIGNSFYFNTSKGALRSGRLKNEEIGNYSTAMGASSATVIYSTAMGASTANGSAATAMGQSVASGAFSTAMGVSIARGGRSAAIGYSIADGEISTAMGQSVASGAYSTAMGGSTANGDFSTAIGGSTAKGRLAISTGFNTIANGYGGLVAGINNDTLVAAQDNYTPTTPLFTVGNGNDINNRSNALVVYKSGNTDHNGYTRLGKTTEAAPLIKMKEIAMTSPATDGGIINTPHGLTGSKIISITASLEYTTDGYVTPGFRPAAGYEYGLTYDAVSVYITNMAGNSANILSKPVKILITYKE